MTRELPEEETTREPPEEEITAQLASQGAGVSHTKSQPYPKVQQSKFLLTQYGCTLLPFL